MIYPADDAGACPAKPRPIWAPYLFAIVSSLLVVPIRLEMDRYLGVESPYLLLFSAVLLSAMVGGRGPGIVAAIVTGIIGGFLFLQPAHLSGLSTVLLLRLSVYALECAAVILICEALHRARHDNERLRRDLAEQERNHKGQMRGALGSLADVAALKQAAAALRAQEQTQRFLARAGEVLASSLDYEATLASVADLVVPQLADWCFVDIVSEDGTLEPVAASHADPEKRALQRQMQERYPTRLDDPVGPASVRRTGKSEWVTRMPEELIRALAYDEEHFRLLKGLGLTSLLCVPLLVRDRTVGVITLISAESGRTYDASDAALAEDLAHRAALAVDNARLYRAAQAEIAAGEQIQRALETSEERLRRAMTETHHRVKNNLQVISAMIDLQTMEETETLPTSEFTRLSQHVRMLATVHDLLTEKAKRDSEANSLSARQLLEKLLPLVQQMACQRRLSFDVEDAILTSDQGASLALIAGEIYSNAIKHGKSEVTIRFYVEGVTAIFEVGDDGPGFPADFDPTREANTGLELVLNLTSLDLKGNLRFDNRPDGGGRVRVVFPLSSQPRVTPSFPAC